MGTLTPFVLGGLVGAGLALLYAPQPGEQTRAVLRRNASDLQQRATQAASSVKEQLPEQVTAVQEQAQTLLAQTKQQVKTATEQGDDTRQSVKVDVKDESRAAAPAAKKPTTKPTTNGSRAEGAQAQLRRDLKTGSENPA